VGDTVTVDGLEQILWPDHCIQGTPGAEFAAKLNLDRVHHFIRKGTDPMIDSYSGFFDNAHRKSTGLEPLLKTAGAKEVHVMGLALDYCVQFTALDALQLGFHTRVLLDGSRGVDLHPGDCDQAIQRMRERGIIVA
jgi:nicotinamidase/pyrazinamidase